MISLSPWAAIVCGKPLGLISFACPDHEERMLVRSPDGTGEFRRVLNPMVAMMCA